MKIKLIQYESDFLHENYIRRNYNFSSFNKVAESDYSNTTHLTIILSADDTDPVIQVFPTHVMREVFVRTRLQLEQLKLISTTGQVMVSELEKETDVYRAEVGNVAGGLYIAQLIQSGKVVWTGRVVVR